MAQKYQRGVGVQHPVVFAREESSFFYAPAEYLAVVESLEKLSISETPPEKRVIKIRRDYKEVPCTVCQIAIGEPCRDHHEAPPPYETHSIHDECIRHYQSSGCIPECALCKSFVTHIVSKGWDAKRSNGYVGAQPWNRITRNSIQTPADAQSTLKEKSETCSTLLINRACIHLHATPLYHACCIRKWLSRSNVCPICNTPFEMARLKLPGTANGGLKEERKLK